jgi:hypothetical protein
MPSTGMGTLDSLIYPRQARSRRISSWDKSGQNRDFIVVAPGETAVLVDITGSGCIKHIWLTVNAEDRLYLRQVVLRIYWDGETEPSVESPLGDFFGVGHARVNHYISLPLNMVTGEGAAQNNQAAMNCFFPMPFVAGARVTITNEAERPIPSFYYYVDYEERPVDPDTLRFHAHWRREYPTQATIDLAGPAGKSPLVHEQANLDGRENYTILEAEGRGHYVGCVLSIDHLNPIPGFSWFGEGDDMIFIDGESWPPSLHGTGTEDYFCAAWGFPSGKYDAPYHGVSLAGATQGPLAYAGKWSVYRWHIEDPICFERSIRVTIEHGHANCHANDYSSVAYWYQTEPHRPFPPLLPVAQRLPLPDHESLKRFWQSI